jgi:hypothetical protein
MMRASALASGALLLVSVLLYFWPLNLSAMEQKTLAAATGPTLSQAYRSAPLTEFDTISSRPLFAKERRRGSAASIDAEEQALREVTKELSATLIGVMEIDGEMRALMAPGLGQDGVWLVTGEKVDGWTISEIGPDTVEVKSGVKSVRLFLYDGSRPGRSLAAPVEIAEENAENTEGLDRP